MDMDERLKKDDGASRRSRALDDRQVTENRAISDDDRLMMFQQQMHNDVLPDIPEIPGYHVCWLTTTNPSDSIQRRMRLGYEPITAADVPGMEFATVKTGDWVGMIGVNEMLAFKLPVHLYQMYMKEAHHDAPLREEDKLEDVANMLRDQARSTGGALIEEEGTADIRQSARAPVFV
jgi:hypothetical protein